LRITGRLRPKKVH
jgi:Ras-related protein Rab-1A